MCPKKELTTELLNLISKYKFAGKGSVSWSIPKERVNIKKDEFQEILKKKTCEDIFDHELRPRITREPALNKAEWLDNDVMRLEFVYKDRSYFIEDEYDIKEIWPTRRASILVTLLKDGFIIESRAEFHQASRLHRIVSSLIGIETQIMDFSDEDIKKIKDALDARKRLARHKRAGGDIDVIEMIASETLNDLDDSEEYCEMLSGDELKKAGYKFRYTMVNGFELDITIYINNNGSIWFVSSAPEEVREHVFSCVRSVKGL